MLDKYGVPFYVDVDQALETLAGLPALPYGIFAQGHGDAYPQADLTAVVVTNRERILHIRQLALAAVEEPQEASQVLKFVADELGVAITQPAIYYLTRTTIHACLNSLRQSGRVDLKLVRQPVALDGDRLACAPTPRTARPSLRPSPSGFREPRRLQRPARDRPALDGDRHAYVPELTKPLLRTIIPPTIRPYGVLPTACQTLRRRWATVLPLQAMQPNRDPNPRQCSALAPVHSFRSYR